VIRTLLLVTIVPVLGCSAEDNAPNTRIFFDPATGHEAVFEFADLNNWKLYSGQAGRVLILERDGRPFVFINDLETGRTLSIASEYGAPDVLTLVDADYDGDYDSLRYGNGTVEVTDIGLDGNIESLSQRRRAE
jgi:hypothetical protein